MLVDGMIQQTKVEKDSYVACEIDNSDRFYDKEHTWKSSFEDDYSPYNSDDYDSGYEDEQSDQEF